MLEIGNNKKKQQQVVWKGPWRGRGSEEAINEAWKRALGDLDMLATGKQACETLSFPSLLRDL